MRVSQERGKQRHFTVFDVESRETESWSVDKSPISIYCTREQTGTALHEEVWTQIKWKYQRRLLDYYDQVVFGALQTCCHCTLLYYTVLWLDLKNIWVIKLYSGCHMPGIASITSALCRETALTNQGLYALGRRQTALYSMGWSHYGSSPQMTIHWSYREKAWGGKKREGIYCIEGHK